MLKFLLLFFTTISFVLKSQIITGRILNSTNSGVEFTNIGILNKNLGTVSNETGQYILQIDSTAYESDTVLISRIGYEQKFFSLGEFKKMNEIKLDIKSLRLNEITVKPKKYTEKELGYTMKSKFLQVGFKDNKLGYELGVLMKNFKAAVLKKVNINFADCTYDSIFYRLNIYKEKGLNEFENILSDPIYITLSNSAIKDALSIDLTEKNIIVEGNFLVSLEHIKNMGKGELNFCGGLMKKSWVRATSQGKWATMPVGISISVLADIEK